ncbi:hypothetical protein, partial [Vibrio coralliirubri]|uniref:hypothetical protein n=1 Tax=Vibrio coralliirubri TaxID=1516159 RepID=UPI000B2D62D3
PLIDYYFGVSNVAFSYFYNDDIDVMDGLFGNILEDYSMSNALYRMKCLKKDVSQELSHYGNCKSSTNLSYLLFNNSIINKRVGKLEDAFNAL